MGVDPLLELCVTPIRLSADRIAELEAADQRLRARRVELETDNEGLQARIAELETKVAAERRAGKRQAPPFSKGEPKADPKRAGRRAGQAYGPKAHRETPDHVDEVVAVPAPAACPGCGGHVVVEDTTCQWVEDIPPVVTFVTRYDLHVGRCAGCDRRVTGRDPGQVSDATGAARSADRTGARSGWPRCCTTSWGSPTPRPRRAAHLPRRPRSPGHQLESRAGHTPDRGQPQTLGR